LRARRESAASDQGHPKLRAKKPTAIRVKVAASGASDREVRDLP
jgi:hypothetical protein